MALPCLGNHHHDGFGKFLTAYQKKFEHIVEVARVRLIGLVDGKAVIEQVAEGLAFQKPLAAAHLVHVAPQRVNLTIVAHESQRLSPVPAREGACREARMDHRKVTREVLVLEVREVRKELLGHKHSLVDNYLRRETYDVEEFFRVKFSISAQGVGYR